MESRERHGRRRALPAAGMRGAAEYGARRLLGGDGVRGPSCAAGLVAQGEPAAREGEGGKRAAREGRGAGRGQRRGCGARRLLGGGPPGAAGRTFWPFSARFTQLRGPRRRRAARAPPMTWGYAEAHGQPGRPAARQPRKPRSFWPKTAEWSVRGRGIRTNQTSLEGDEPGLASSRRQRSRQRHQRGAQRQAGKQTASSQGKPEATQPGGVIRRSEHRSPNTPRGGHRRDPRLTGSHGPLPNATAGGPAGEPPAASGLGSAAPRAPDRAG